MNVLDMKNNKLILEIELTPQDTKTLGLLSNGNFNRYDTLIDYTKINGIIALRSEISRLKKKTGLNIRSVFKKGYKLKDELYLDY